MKPTTWKEASLSAGSNPWAFFYNVEASRRRRYVAFVNIFRNAPVAHFKKNLFERQTSTREMGISFFFLGRSAKKKMKRTANVM